MRQLALLEPSAPEHVRRSRGTRRRADRLAGLVADARAGVAVRAALGELRRGLGPDRLPAAAVQHDRHRGHLDDRHVARRARSWRTASRGSGSPAAALLFTLLIATIFLPAAVTIIPTYTIFQKLGWVGHVAAAARPDVLRQRLRRVPDAPVLHDDPDRDGRGGGDRRRRPVPDADLGDPAAGVAGRSSPSRSSTSCTRGTTSSAR